MLLASKRTEKLIWGHMEGDMSQKLKQYPGIKRVASPAEVHRLYLLYFTGLLPFTDLEF